MPKIYYGRDGHERYPYRKVMILLQTHRVTKFGQKDSVFYNDYMQLRSSCSPENCGSYVYVRGTEMRYDYSILSIRESRIEKFLNAIKAYNKEFECSD